MLPCLAPLLRPRWSLMGGAAVLVAARLGLQAFDGGTPQARARLGGCQRRSLLPVRLQPYPSPRGRPDGHRGRAGVRRYGPPCCLDGVDLVWRDGPLPWLATLTLSAAFAASSPPSRLRGALPLSGLRPPSSALRPSPPLLRSPAFAAPPPLSGLRRPPPPSRLPRPAGSFNRRSGAEPVWRGRTSGARRSRPRSGAFIVLDRSPPGSGGARPRGRVVPARPLAAARRHERGPACRQPHGTACPWARLRWGSGRSG
ncbi:hypothetical protein [Nonomuraea dietziae]|uniref:hypothetical protein n=1 Tax=Nonomuraea dietziae TaxID=65515 RepID=UPI0031D988E4